MPYLAFFLFNFNLFYFINLYLCLFNLILFIFCFIIFLIIVLYSKLKWRILLVVYGLSLINLSFYFIISYLSISPWSVFPVSLFFLINFIYLIVNYKLYKSKFKSIQFSEFKSIIDRFLLYFYWLFLHSFSLLISFSFYILFYSFDFPWFVSLFIFHIIVILLFFSYFSFIITIIISFSNSFNFFINLFFSIYYMCSFYFIRIFVDVAMVKGYYLSFNCFNVVINTFIYIYNNNYFSLPFEGFFTNSFLIINLKKLFFKLGCLLSTNFILVFFLFFLLFLVYIILLLVDNYPNEFYKVITFIFDNFNHFLHLFVKNFYSLYCFFANIIYKFCKFIINKIYKFLYPYFCPFSNWFNSKSDNFRCNLIFAIYYTSINIPWIVELWRLSR